MKFLDFFAGIGGLRVGMEKAGHTCVGFCEYNEFAVASYTSMHLLTKDQRSYLETLPLKQRQKEILKEQYRNGEWYAKDITTVTSATLPRADVWCFGAPCTSFSLSGKRKGLDGESGLILEIFRLLKETESENRPEWLIYENVKGMFSSNRGFDFLAILLEMDELGYDVEWQVFNSKYFGVGQNRERVYTIGHLRNRGRRNILPIQGTNAEGKNGLTPHCIGGIGEKRSNGGTQFYQQDRIYDGTTVATTLCAQLPRTGSNYYIMPIDMSTDRCKLNNGIAHCLNANDQRKIFGAKQTRTMVGLDIPLEHTEDIIKLPFGEDIYAIWVEKYQTYMVIRKLTPKECFRLQGFSDEHYEKAAFVNLPSQLYKQTGNSVTVNIVESIAKKL